MGQMPATRCGFNDIAILPKIEGYLDGVFVKEGDRKEVDKAFTELKKEGAIISPVRCKWAPAQ